MLFFTLTLLGCLGRQSSAQVDLRGLLSYLEYPVAISDTDLSARLATPQLETILWRLKRCRLRTGSCQVEVRIFRNQHVGQGHLSNTEVVRVLTDSGVSEITTAEKLDLSPGADKVCWVVVRVLPK